MYIVDGGLDSPHGKHCPYDLEMDFFADAVEYEDPFICFRGRELFRSYMQSIADHGARMVINDIYQARLRSQPGEWTAEAQWVARRDDRNSNSQKHHEKHSVSDGLIYILMFDPQTSGLSLLGGCCSSRTSHRIRIRIRSTVWA